MTANTFRSYGILALTFSATVTTLLLLALSPKLNPEFTASAWQPALALLAKYLYLSSSSARVYCFSVVTSGIVCTWLRVCLFDRQPVNYLLLITCLINLSISFAISQTGFGWCSWFFIANLPILACVVLTRRPKHSSLNDTPFTKLQVRDYVIVCALTTVLSAPLLFALNVWPNNFEGELSPYYAAGTSISGSFYANLGWRGPWAPLGLLYYVPLWLTEEWLGPTVIAVRVGAYLPGILALPLTYLLIAKLHSRCAAVIASTLVLLGTISIGWNRSDIHPHGATLWPSLLVALTLCAFLSKRTLGRGLILTATTALTWHQYPSGQIIGLLPICSWILLVALRQSEWRRWSWSKTWLTIFFFGLVLVWGMQSFVPELLISGELKAFRIDTIYGARTAWGSPTTLETGNTLTTLATRTIENAKQLIWGILYNQEPLFFQTFLPNVHEPERRATVPWLILPFALTGLLALLQKRHHIAVAVLCSWIVLAPVPAILSSAGYPKRAATLYPALSLLAAIGMAEILALVKHESNKLIRNTVNLIVAVIFSFYYAHQLNAYFFTNHPKFKAPEEVAIAEQLKNQLTPNTLVIGLFWDHYFHGKYGYLLNQRLHDLAGSVYFINAYIPVDQIDHSTIAEAVNNFWLYWWTQLHETRDKVSEMKIERALYLIQADPPAHDTRFIDQAHTITNDQRCIKTLDLTNLESKKHRLSIYNCPLNYSVSQK